MKGLVTYHNLGTIAYAEGVEVQEQYFQKVLEQKQSGTLGSFDPTLLLNGQYALMLHAWDAAGNQTDVVRIPLASG